MKVYSLPTEAPQAPDHASFDYENWHIREEQHAEQLAAWLRAQGYTGKHSGKIVRFGVADGYAEYMLADGKGRYGGSFLFHLPYGDAWHYQPIQHLPKKYIIEQIERQEPLAALFSKKATA